MSKIEDQFDTLMEMNEINHITTDDLMQYDDYGVESFSSDEEIEARARKAKDHDPENDSYAGKQVAEDEKNETFSHFRTFSTPRIHKYTKTEMERIRKSCEGLIVRDYGPDDPYHWDDKRRASMDTLSDMTDDINKLHRTYNSADEYVKAMRTIWKAWDAIEKQFNLVHTRKEFFEMVGSGEIVNNRLVMPILRHKNRYDMDVLMTYISNPDLNPNDLIDEKTRKAEEAKAEEQRQALNNVTDDDKFDDVILDSVAELLLSVKKDNIEDPNGDDNFYANVDEDGKEIKDKDKKKGPSDEEIKAAIEAEITETVMTPEELEFIEQQSQNPPSYEVMNLERKYVKGYDESIFNRRRRKKNSKKDKIRAARAAATHKMLKKIQDVERRMHEGTTFITHGMFDPSDGKDHVDDFYINGSLASKANDELFDMMMIERFMNTPEDSAVGSRTTGDVEETHFFNIIDANPIFNSQAIRRSMNASIEDLQQRNTKKTRKENARMEKRILDRIIKLNNNPKFKKMTTKTEQKLAKDIEGK